jgi:putative transposase
MGRCRSYRYLLQPTVPQRTRLEALLRNQCELYNAALEERRGAWKWERRSVSYIDQSRTLTTVRAARPEILDHGVTVCRGTLKRLDRAFGAFYRRCRAGQTPGFPRFKSSRRWDSVQWEDTSGWRLNAESRRLRLLGIGEVKVNLHRELRGIPKAITVAREGRRWWVTVRCVDVPATPLVSTGDHVGIDLGVIAQVATSDGRLVVDGRYGRRSSAALAAAQRELVTKQLGSRHRERAVERVAAARELVNRYDLIVHEDLKITNMVRRPHPRKSEDDSYEPNGAAAKAGLNRSISDAGWGQLLQFIAYKAEDAGREVIAVDPRHTSQRCSSCEHQDRENRRTQAEFKCRACGHEAHADVNAAMNILRAGRARRAPACEGSAN